LAECAEIKAASRIAPVSATPTSLGTTGIGSPRAGIREPKRTTTNLRLGTREPTLGTSAPWHASDPLTQNRTKERLPTVREPCATVGAGPATGRKRQMIA
jgi:hypothetical protein